jgi:hypothetical protein
MKATEFLERSLSPLPRYDRGVTGLPARLAASLDFWRPRDGSPDLWRPREGPTHAVSTLTRVCVMPTPVYGLAHSDPSTATLPMMRASAELGCPRSVSPTAARALWVHLQSTVTRPPPLRALRLLASVKLVSLVLVFTLLTVAGQDVFHNESTRLISVSTLLNNRVCSLSLVWT